MKLLITGQQSMQGSYFKDKYKDMYNIKSYCIAISLWHNLIILHKIVDLELRQ